MLLGHSHLLGLFGQELRRIAVSRDIRQVLRYDPVASLIDVRGKSHHTLRGVFPSDNQERSFDFQQDELRQVD